MLFRSMSPRVSTFSTSEPLIRMGIDSLFEFITAVVTEYISSEGDTGVDPDFLFALEVEFPPRFCVFAIALFMRKKMFCSLTAHSYHSLRLVGGVEKDLMFRWRGIGSVSLKYSTTASFFESFDLVTNILNLETCSSIVVLPILISFGASYGEKSLTIRSINSL